MKIEFSRESRAESREPDDFLTCLSCSRPSALASRLLRAFTLLEVMIAVAIFFMAMFSILALVTQCLRSAYALNRNAPTAGMVAAEQIAMTNKLEEGFSSDDFGDLYPDYNWEMETTLITNGFFQVDIAVYNAGRLDSAMSIYSYKPESATGLSTQSKFRK